MKNVFYVGVLSSLVYIKLVLAIVNQQSKINTRSLLTINLKKGHSRYKVKNKKMIKAFFSFSISI